MRIEIRSFDERNYTFNVETDNIAYRSEMGWTRPEYSRQQVDAAGRILVDDALVDDIDEYVSALGVINNWRSSHAYPLNTFQMNLRTKLKRLRIGKGAFVAQRIKRLPAIEHKLSRMPHLRLSEMQDIGGCRAVVRTVRNVRQLRESFLQSQIKHRFQRETDYISEPKDDGYRGIHLIYRYHSDKIEAYQGMKIEVQLRTRLQHAWATAVETVGTFRQEMLKSDQGDEDWLRFFALMGTAIALREKCPIVPDTPKSAADLADGLRSYVNALDVIGQLSRYQTALSIAPSLQQHPSLKGNHYFLLELDPATTTIRVTGYKKSETERALQDYQRMERRTFAQSGPDAVLVSVDKVAALKRAYPNYFVDTSIFLDEVTRAIES